MSWAWKCSDQDCDFAEDQPAEEAAIAALLTRCVEHEDAHEGHMALAYRVVIE
jgi:hypothetical protein